ncbi:MAG TPA: DUF952 domain-containing protein [Jatrophihabitans sp.]|jgi:uncharacterized protein (DUF952 family)
MTSIFHVVDADDWATAGKAGEYRPLSLDGEGFVHFSFAEQVDGVLQRYYQGVGNLVLVEFDPDRLSLPVVVEDLAGSGAFPHVYGPIPTVAAVSVRPLQ